MPCEFPRLDQRGGEAPVPRWPHLVRSLPRLANTASQPARIRLNRVRSHVCLALVGVAVLGVAGSGEAGNSASHARSRHGMVVSASPLAAEVGAGILQQGGNAVDAAVAAAFALSVVEPSMSGLGGRTQILIRLPDGSSHGVDGTTQVPANAPVRPGHSSGGGYGSIGIPGTVAALASAHRSFGRLAWPRVLAPAITLARKGFPLPPEEARRIALVADELRAFSSTRSCFLDADGAPLQAGRDLVQRDLARVLESLARSGPDVFYRGWIAESIAADMERHGGHVTRADLADYEARSARVVRGRYRGHELTGTYPPPTGAATIEALQILGEFETSPGTPGWVGLVAQCLLFSFEDRAADWHTPGSQADQLTSLEWARRRAGDVRPPEAGGRTAPLAGPWTSPRFHESPHTTHVSVGDEQRMLVALTQSLGPSMGSRVSTPGLGFVYAATMGYLDRLAPGDRPWSSQSPLIVTRDGCPAYVLGAAGARRIISSIVEVVSRMIDGGQTLVEAIARPRFHATPGELYMEMTEDAAWRADDLGALRRLGFAPVARSRASYFARIHGIEIDTTTGEYTGVADPRGDGGAAGVVREAEARRPAAAHRPAGGARTLSSAVEDHAGPREPQVAPSTFTRRDDLFLKSEDSHD